MSALKDPEICAPSLLCSSSFQARRGSFYLPAYSLFPLHIYGVLHSVFIETMHYTLAVLAAAAVVKASPFPQAVTAAISPTGASPPGCTGSRPDPFGIAVMNVTTASAGHAKRQVSQIDE